MAEHTIALLENKHTVIYDGQKPVLDTKNKNPELFSAIVVPLKYINSLSFKISNALSDDELAMKIELRMYKDAGLDPEKEYTIDFIKYDLGDEYYIEVFALSKDDFEHYIKDFSYKIDVIDLALPRFFIYEALYDTNESTTSNDLYIYIHDDEAVAAIYQNGKYIGHRLINSLSAISRRTGLELVKVKEYLQEKGFKRNNYTLEETPALDAIIEVFSKDIEKIVYSINHKRMLFGLSDIHSIFIDFDGHNLEGIEDLFSQHGFAPTTQALIQQKEQLGPSESIVLDYLFKLHNGMDFHVVNLTHLARKTPLTQYIGFRYFIETIVTIVLFLGIAIFVTYYLSTQKDRISYLDSRVKKKNKKIKELSTELKKIKKKNNHLLANKKELEDKIFVYETTFRVIPMMGQIGVKRQKAINDILKVLKKYRLNASSILQIDSDNIEIELLSKSKERATISRFMHDLIQMGYINVTTKDITYENGVYKSKVYISREKKFS